MFRLTVEAPTFHEMRTKLQEAANYIYDDATSSAADDDEGDGDGARPVLAARVPIQSTGVAMPAFRNDPPPAMPAFAATDVTHPNNAHYAPTMHAPASPMPAYAAPPMPAFAAQPAPVQNGAVELDSRGIAWNAEVHSETKAFNKDGSWRARRGVDKAELKRVEKQAAAPQAFSPVPPPPAPTVEVPTFQQPAAVPAPVAQRAYQDIQIPDGPVPSAHTLETFRANIIPVMSGLVRDKKIDQAYVEQLKDWFKVKEIWHVRDNEQQLAELFNNFVKAGLITRVG